MLLVVPEIRKAQRIMAMKCVVLVAMLVAGGASASAAEIMLQEQINSWCLTAIGNSSEPLSFVMTQPCSHPAPSSQLWTFDGARGFLCSVSFGGECVHLFGLPKDRDIKSSDSALVLATRGYYRDQQPLAFDYNPTTMAFSVKGNCSLLLDGINGALDDRPSAISFAAGFDCNNPVAGYQQWKVVSP
jgi:hypothetical protein